MLLHAWIIGRALLWTAVRFHHVQHYVMMPYSKLLSLIFICVCQLLAVCVVVTVPTKTHGSLPALYLKYVGTFVL